MTAEQRQALESVNKTLEDFKTNNDKALGEKAEKGYVDSSLKEASEKIEADMFAKIDKLNKQLTERFDGLEGQLERFELGGGSGTNDLAADAELFTATTGREVSLEQYKQYKEAFGSYLRKGDRALSSDLNAALSVGSDPQGGYWVESAVGRDILKRFETSPIRQIANVETISTDSLEGTADLDEATVGWVGETEARAETATPDLDKYRIPVHEQYAMPKATQKLLDDANRDVEGWLARKVADKLIRTENTAFVDGSGSAQPRGFMTRTFVTTDDDTRAWGEVEYVATGADADFATAPAGWDTFIDVIGTLKAQYRAGSVWVMNRTTLAAAMKEKDSNGNHFWTSDLTSNGFGFRILNFPVVEAEDMDDIASDSFSIAFGNFREAYTIVDRVGIRVLRDPFSDKPHILFYTTKRVGGDVVNSEAYKVIKFGTS